MPTEGGSEARRGKSSGIERLVLRQAQAIAKQHAAVSNSCFDRLRSNQY